MQELVSPKQLARAIGVSESSVKRWCDRGVIETIRTAGGHRKLPMSSVLEFLQTSGHDITDPDVISLPTTVGHGARTMKAARQRLKEKLIAGQEIACRQIILDLFLAKTPVSVICDEVIATVFEEIGDLWDCGDVEVYQERRSCEICQRILHELRSSLGSVPEGAPVAIGGTLDEDRYTLSTTMAELVLRDNGWNATSLGCGLPFTTLKAAIKDTQPQLFWLSVSFVREEEKFLDEVNRLYDSVCESGAAMAVGGYALTDDLRKQMKYSAFCDTMQHLESFATSIDKRT